jgi:hypothetical protein
MKASRHSRILAAIGALGLAIAGLSLACALAASAATPYRPAQPVHIIFTGNPSSGLEPEVDLRPKIRSYVIPIRDQGNRGTCTVFATTFLIEYQKAGMTGVPGGHILSEEYLNWAGNKATSENSDGGFFTKFMAGFAAYGISSAKAMPYQATYDPTQPDAPSATTIASAQAMFPTKYPFTVLKVWDDTKGMTSAELQTALATLRSGRPVATGIWWLSTFATVTVHGVPLLKDYPRSANVGSNPPMFDGHTIDLVGFRQSSKFPGGGYFIFRNSMGKSFGDKGYGFVSFQYLRTYSNDAIAISPQPWRPIYPNPPPKY